MLLQARYTVARRAAVAVIRSTRASSPQCMAYHDDQPTLLLQKTARMLQVQVPPFGGKAPNIHELSPTPTRLFSTMASVEGDPVEKAIFLRIDEKDLQGALVCLKEFAQANENQQPSKLPVAVTLALLQQCAECIQQSYYDPTERIQAAKIAIQVLQLENLLRQQHRLTGQPKRHFKLVLQALSRMTTQKDKSNGMLLLDPGREAQLVLEQALQTFHETRHPDDEVHWEHYHMVLDTYRRCNQPFKAELLLKKMGKSKALHHIDPHLVAYRIVIEAYLQKMKTEGTAIERIQSADALLRYQLQEWELSQNKHIQPDVSLFNLVMNAWSESKDLNASQHVKSLYHLMIQSQVYPDLYSYSQRINAHANRGDAAGAEDAFLEIYQTQQQGNANPDNQYPPIDIACLNAVLKAWGHSNDPHALEKMSDILQETRDRFQQGSEKLQLNKTSYITLLTACAKRGRVSQAAQLIKEMVDDARSGNTTVVMDDIPYNLWLKAVQRARHERGGEQADFVLEEMNRCHVPPTQYTYATALACWKATIDKSRKMDNSQVARGKDRVKELEALYAEVGGRMANAATSTSNLSNPHPPADIASLNAVLKSWEQSNDPDCLEKMKDTLQETRNRFKLGLEDLQLDTISYTTLLTAFAKRGRSYQAAQLIEEMIQDARSGNTTVVMDDIPFNLLLKAVQNAQTAKAGDQADFILEKMRLCQVQPTQYTYATAIACWKITIALTRKMDPNKVAQGKQRIQELRVWRETGKESG
jgi:pentatricopeptide repeat protein